MNIFLVRDGKRQGPYSIGQVVEFIQKNECSMSDLVWREGMIAWQPIHSIEEIVDAVLPPLPSEAKKSPQTLPPPIPIQTSASQTQADVVNIAHSRRKQESASRRPSSSEGRASEETTGSSVKRLLNEFCSLNWSPRSNEIKERSGKEPSQAPLASLVPSTLELVSVDKPGSSSANEWYFCMGDNWLGPVSEGVLIDKIKSGSLDKYTKIRKRGLPDWVILENTALVRFLPTSDSPILDQAKIKLQTRPSLEPSLKDASDMTNTADLPESDTLSKETPLAIPKETKSGQKLPVNAGSMKITGWMTVGFLGLIFLVLMSCIQPTNIPASGQFLFDPLGVFVYSENLQTIISCGLLFGVAILFRQKIVSSFCPSCTNGAYMTGIGSSAILSIVAVLVIQFIAQIYSGLLLSFLKDDNISTSTKINIGRICEQLMSHIHNEQSQVFVIAFAVLLFLVGGGYAFSAVDASLFTHMLSFTIGVGILEEMSKALVGLALYSHLLKRKSGDSERAVVTAFGIAGFGFGTGEALHYFGVYAHADLGFVPYLQRCLWCVPLHMSWTVITGTLAANTLVNLHRAPHVKFPDELLIIFVFAIPSIVMHGIYDAFCTHGNILSWAVGAGSIIWAFKLTSSKYKLTNSPR